MILVLADDLTGALEVGAIFAGSGFDAIVTTRPAPDVAPEVLIADTETRHCTPSDAFDRIIGLVTEFGVTPELLYKKTDSTLRGNIGPELAALSTLFPEWRIAYAPAHPEQGRVVIDGIVYVNGVPVTESDFARDCLNPVFTSSVRELVGPELPCTIFDGSNDLDVKNTAMAILSDATMRIAAGPAALARALVAQLPSRDGHTPDFPHVATCVVVNGSRTEVARSQERYAERQGCLVRSDTAAWALIDADIAADSMWAAVASLRAERVVHFLRQRSSDGVFLIGGDTAYAFVSALGDPPVIPIGELVPGVAISRIRSTDLAVLPGYDRDLVLITKAGGFGDVDVLCRVRQILEQNAG